ncbi:transketolase family protein [Candidatus Nomurabacteria bacterium]|jgi:transketolase|nr:transketolase family protein [Candidatus Saccharibacteria bacterium]MCB9839914.1 transketolase family protein [Candidatus Nomurabacteria bacterium]
MNLHLNDYLIDVVPKVAIRKGFGEGLKKAGELNENIVALSADLTESTQIHFFKEAFPDRFFEVGIAEQNLATVGSGLAAMGKIPFISSYAAFSPGRNWEQIKTTAALNNLPVKVVGAHAGLYTGPDGATHQMLEDIALMRVMPNMVVIAPGDAVEAEKATMAMAEDPRPNYIRLSREATPVFTSDKTPFEIGKAYIFEPGHDITIISTGTMTYPSLVAAHNLFKDGIDVEVIHCPTIKPLDAVTLLQSIKKTGAVITVEEAQKNGGLGGAVAELLAENLPTPMRRMGVGDEYGQSGTASELLEHYGLTTKHIMLEVHSLLSAVGKM